MLDNNILARKTTDAHMLTIHKFLVLNSHPRVDGQKKGASCIHNYSLGKQVVASRTNLSGETSSH